MKISITIMAHPKRRKQAEKLLVQLAGQGFINCYITWDQINNEWDTGSRALRRGIDAGGLYHVVIQDDAILPPNFYEHCVNALNAVPQRVLVSLYTGTVRPLPDRVAHAVKKAAKCSWLKSNLLYWGVGIAIPTNQIADMLDFVADRTEVYDQRIGWAYMRQALPVYYTNPSLVDHDEAIGSLIGNGYAGVPRKAHNFIGDRQVTWNNLVIDI